MIKRLLDFVLSFFGLLLLGPFLIFFILLVWMEDYASPFYFAWRVGKNRKPFRMIKIRSMVVDADKKGAETTGLNDKRITKVGEKIRKYKIDELSQLINVIIGDMSLVGPRPNTPNEVEKYNQQEKCLLNVKPGITDFSSIVFSNEAEVVGDHYDPDYAYDILIRPLKSRLGLIYIENQSNKLDLKIIIFTLAALINRKLGLELVQSNLKRLGFMEEVKAINSLVKRLDYLKEKDD